MILLLFQHNKKMLKVYFPLEYFLIIIGLLKRIHGLEFLNKNILYTIRTVWITISGFILMAWTICKLIDVIIQVNIFLANNHEMNLASQENEQNHAFESLP
jgi:hypothetical protein